MVFFWILALLLALAAAGLVTWPLWRQGAAARSGATLWALLLLIPAAASVLYVTLSTWDWQQPLTTTAERQQELPPVDQMTQALADRLARQPDDPEGWQLLGRSYVALGNYPGAVDAYQQAWARVANPDNSLKLALAEALTLTDQRNLLGEAGELVEAVLQDEPRNARALWYGGLAALLGERPEVATDRWRLLLTLSPPEPVARALRERLTALGAPVAGAPTQTAATNESANAPAAPEGAFEIRVSVGAGVGATTLPASTQLFIIARNPQGGPPLAVVRHAPTLPGVFSLSDANAMLPGNSLADFEQLQFVARLSRSGQPIAQSGDLFGQVLYDQGGDPVIELVIDQAVP
jgi:cytochrome c-type biogenesis protein CcmH